MVKWKEVNKLKSSFLFGVMLVLLSFSLEGCTKKDKNKKVVQLQPMEELPDAGEFKIYPRNAWTEEGPDETKIVSMAPIFRVTIHHTAMPDDELPDLGGSSIVRLQKILLWHKHHQNWADIGYHYVIDSEGKVWEGRNIKYQGAHAGNEDFDIGNIGVVLIGNFEDHELPEKQKQAMVDFVHFLKEKYKIQSNNVFSHEHFKGTKCPGKFVVPIVEQLRIEK